MVVPESEAEEVAERRFNARGGFAVPVHAQNQSFQMIWRGIIDREPDVGDIGCIVCIETRKRVSGVLLRVTCSFWFGAIYTVMVIFGMSTDKSTTMILQAFFSLFALGILAANVTFRLHPMVSGALVGLLISLPDAIAMKSYPGI